MRIRLLHNLTLTLSYKERGSIAFALVLLYFSAFVTPARAVSPSIIINEVQITGGIGQTGRDFVELYNPTESIFNLKGYRLVKRTKTGTTDTSLKSWNTDTTIPTKGYFLWVSSSDPDWAASIHAGASTSQTIAGDNGIALRFGPENDGIIIDSVAWGAAQNAFVEGSNFPTNPDNGQSIERTGEIDTDHNAIDFALISVPTPTQTASNDSLAVNTDTSESTTSAINKAEDQETSTTPSVSTDATPITTKTVPDPVLILNEILPNPFGSDVNEFIEIKNPRFAPFELRGWTIANKRGQTFTFDYRTIPASGIIALHRAETGIILQNDAETVSLTAPNETTAYATIQIKKAPEGQSLIFDDDGWKWTTMPTPGGENKFVPQPKPPVLITAIPKKATIGEILLFDASDSYDPEGSPLVITWNFDETFGTYEGSDTTYIYTKPGTYTVTLSAINIKGMLTTKETKITVTDIEPHTILMNLQTETSPPTKQIEEKNATKKQTTDINATTTASTWMEGVITVPPGILSSLFGYIECLAPCEGQGIKIRMTKAEWPTLTQGDIIRLSGTWSESGGEPSFLTKASLIAKTPRQQRITPTSMKLSELTDTMLNHFIALEGDVTQKSGTTAYIDDGTDEMEIEIKNATHRRLIIKGDRIRVAGILIKKGDGHYQLRTTEKPDVLNAAPKDPQKNITIQRSATNDRTPYVATSAAALAAMVARPIFLLVKKRGRKTKNEVTSMEDEGRDRSA